jgi:peptidylprolyl isomerase
LNKTWSGLLLVVASCALAAEPEVKVTASGLKCETLKAGRPGSEPVKGDRVSVHYVGTFPDGRKFDSSRDRGQPFEFTVGAGEVISGWDEGLTLMGEGGTYKLTVPGKLAYGEQGSPPAIGPNATLVFEIEVLKVTRAEAPPKLPAADAAKQHTTASGLVWQALADGGGDSPRPDQGVTVNWSLWTADGKLVVSSGQMGGPLGGLVSTLTLGPKPLAFLPEAVQLMKLGGSCRFDVPAKLAWGDTAVAAQLPANSPTVWVLDLVKINDVPKFETGDAAKTRTTPSGLKIEVIKEGAGAAPTARDDVTVQYTGWMTDGHLFDSSQARGEPAHFNLSQVIAGWTEGLQTMKEGGVARLTIPAKLAYGDRPPPGIAPGATLIFLVELIKVDK